MCVCECVRRTSTLCVWVTQEKKPHSALQSDDKELFGSPLPPSSVLTEAGHPSWTFSRTCPSRDSGGPVDFLHSCCVFLSSVLRMCRRTTRTSAMPTAPSHTKVGEERRGEERRGRVVPKEVGRWVERVWTALDHCLACENTPVCLSKVYRTLIFAKVTFDQLFPHTHPLCLTARERFTLMAAAEVIIGKTCPFTLTDVQ